MENKENIKKTYKYCVVPMCNNTTVSAPNKIFFHIIKNETIREQWWRLMRRAPLSSSTSAYCCEDHFNLEEDVDNYTEYKLMCRVPRLKKNVFPTRFACQNRVEIASPQAKKRRSVDVDEILPSAGTSRTVFEPIENIDIENRGKIMNTQEMGSQASFKPNVRSKRTQAEGPKTRTVALSPIAIKALPVRTDVQTSSSSPSTVISEEFVPEEDSEDSVVAVLEKEKFQLNMLKCTLECTEREPRLMLGLPPESYFLIKTLSEEIPCEYRNILITLKKIRLNFVFAVLALDFGMSVSNISRIFKTTLVPMAEKLNQLIYWPSRELVELHLPIAFRARYKKVTTIIDCFEIEIEKPSDPVHQALTWSDYYKCNTIKYLISCTPDGLVNFVTNGYGGRASDVTIIEDSNYFEKLEAGMMVMADRGFKNLSHLLLQRHCELVRPPSVFAGVPSTKAEVKQSKRIAALRIHVERVIGRVREFKMLLPHACVDNHLISYMDLVVKIACGVINLQDHLIKRQI